MIEHLYYGVRLFSFNAKFNLSWLIIIYGDPGTTSYPPHFCMLNKAPRGSIRSKIFFVKLPLDWAKLFAAFVCITTKSISLQSQRVEVWIQWKKNMNMLNVPLNTSYRKETISGSWNLQDGAISESINWQTLKTSGAFHKIFYLG